MQGGVPVPRALTIAGSDSGGGAGIQADLKTFHALEVFGMSAVTAVTAQNTREVRGIYPLPPEAVAAQIDAVVEDIGIDAAKTGMLFSREIVEIVADRVRAHEIHRLVVDPVMRAKSGASLLAPEAEKVLREHLFPLTLLVTPNLPEVEALLGEVPRTRAEKKEAACRLLAYGPKAVLVKGGHAPVDEGGNPVSPDARGRKFVEDVLATAEGVVVFRKDYWWTPHTHGTGCTFSAAVTAALAQGTELVEAVALGEAFIDAAIRHAFPLGKGHGLTNHWAFTSLRFDGADLTVERWEETCGR